MWTLLAALSLAGQTESPAVSECWYGQVDAPCWAEVRALYGAPPIEGFPRIGLRVVRVFLHDNSGWIRKGLGYEGSQAGLLVAERGPDGIARLTFRPAPQSGSANIPLRMPLTESDWLGIEHIAGGLTDIRTGSWCLHSWGYLAEVADPGGRVVRHAETCGAGVEMALADRMARLAMAAIRNCDARSVWRTSLERRIQWLNRCSRRADGPGLRR